jgi:cytoskeletal protein CcmA (bactofilin family)
MGLFGRDDRTDGSNPSPAEGHARQRHTPASSSTVTLIAGACHVEGEIKGAGEVHIEGTVKGKLDCSSSVLVAEGGKVEAEVKAETITIAGKLKGDAIASQKIELTPTAEVEGDITAPRILIREGATFEGQVFMTGKKSAKAPEPAKKEEKGPKTEKK